jgi:hypothetical protein
MELHHFPILEPQQNDLVAAPALNPNHLAYIVTVAKKFNIYTYFAQYKLKIRGQSWSRSRIISHAGAA